MHRLLCLAFVLVAGVTQAWAAPLLSVEPSYQLIKSGTVTTVDLRISGLGDGAAPSLGGFDFTILYDPTIVSVLDVQFGGELGDPGLLEALVNADLSIPGAILIQEVSLLEGGGLDANQPAEFVMVTLTFRGGGPGISPIDYSLVTLADASGGLLDGETVSGAIEVFVPEPETAILLGTALLAVLLLKRKTIHTTYRNG